MIDGEVDVGRRGLVTHLLLAPLTEECLSRGPGEARRAGPEASLRPCRQWPRASKYRNAQEGRYDLKMVALAAHDRVLCGDGPAARLIDRARWCSTTAAATAAAATATAAAAGVLHG